MNKKYKVKLVSGSTYEVLEDQGGDFGPFEWESVFQGSLADCEAYIRLNEQGYM